MLGKYPFMSKARGLLASRGLQKVGYDELERAKSRAVQSVSRAGAKDFAIGSPPSENESVESYAIARLLLSVLDSEYYWSKFARGEAALAAAFLREESDESLLEISRDFFPAASFANGSFEIPLPQFLSYGIALPKAMLGAGVVHLERQDMLSLLRYAIVRKTMEKPSAKAEGEQLKQAALELSEMLPKPIEAVDFSGSYLSLPCMQSILKGVGEGKRYYASMALAIACRKDDLPKEKAVAVMQQFVNNSSKQTHPFTMREAQASLDWVYRRPSVRFNCPSNRSHGLAPPECAYPCTHDRATRQGK